MDRCIFLTTVKGRRGEEECGEADLCQINEMRICTLVTESTCAEWEQIKKEEHEQLK